MKAKLTQSQKPGLLKPWLWRMVELRLDVGSLLTITLDVGHTALTQ